MLPFGLAIPSLPKLGSVYMYAIKFSGGIDDISWQSRTDNEHVLLFVDDAVLGKVKKQSTRAALLDDETGNRTHAVHDVRENGAIMVTTFTWTASSNTATFPMREDVVARLCRNDQDEQHPWVASLMRTDDWSVFPDSVRPVATSIRRLTAWMD